MNFISAVFILEILPDLFYEIRREGIWIMCQIQIQRCVAGRICLRNRDLAILEHRVNHESAPAQRMVGMVDGRIVKRRFRQSGDQRGFRKSQLSRRFAEVILRRSFETVNSVAQVNLVRVKREYLLLSESALDLDGEQGLLNLAVK